MEILKKVKIGKVDYAWVTTDNTHAELILYDKDDAKALADGKKKKDKKDRLIEVQSEIKRLKQKYGITND